MNLIAFGFEAQNGKDTAASVLVERYGYNYRAIAGPVKEGARELFGLSYGQVWGSDKDVVDTELGCTPRKILQDLMLTMRQTFGETFALRTLQRQLRADGRYVIPDLRRINEAEWVKSLGGKVVLITRPGVKSAIAADAAGHITEHELATWSGWDYTIVNDGTLYDLVSGVDAMMSAFQFTAR